MLILWIPCREIVKFHTSLKLNFSNWTYYLITETSELGLNVFFLSVQGQFCIIFFVFYISVALAKILITVNVFSG